MKRSITPRAHASEDKAERRAAILTAASQLFDTTQGALPTAAQIASASGLAKGTVYLYFRTKEEIFASLLLEEWGAVMKQCRQAFESTRGARRVKIDAFLSSLVAHLDSHPGLLRLDALAYSVLERNMPHEALAAHKAEYLSRMSDTGRVIDAALKLPEGRGLQLLMRTYAMTSGLWQSYQHADATLQAGVPVMQSFASKPFGEELHEALAEYWRGAVT